MEWTGGGGGHGGGGGRCKRASHSRNKRWRMITTRRNAYGNFEPPRRSVQRKPLQQDVEVLAEKTLELYEAYVARKLPGRFSRKRQQKCKEIFVEELTAKMKSPTFFKKAMLVDCRSEEEYHVSSIKGAIHVSVLEDRMFEDHREYAMEEMSELVEEIICFDTVGMRSAHVALKLQDRAIYYPRIYNLRGGLLQWTHVGEDLFAPPLSAQVRTDAAHAGGYTHTRR